MMEFIKKQGVAFWLSAVAVLLSVIGFITMLVSNATQGYSLSGLGLMVVAVIVSILCIVAGVYFSDKMGGHAIIPAALSLVAVLLLSYLFGNMLLNRAELASALFTYDAVNTVGWGVFRVSVVAIVCYLVSAILIAVSGFMAKDKKAE